MPLFWFHESKGLPLVISSGKRAGMRGSRGTLSRRFSASMLHVLWEKGDFSTPLRFGRNDDRGAPTPSSRAGLRAAMGADGKRFDDTLSREISRRNAARTIRGGDFSAPLRFGRNDGGRGRLFIICAPKGETTHYILRVASAPSPTAVTDSLDFQVADAPLQIQFALCKMCSLCTEGRYHTPQPVRAVAPPERSDATLLHNLRRSRAPFL